MREKGIAYFTEATDSSLDFLKGGGNRQALEGAAVLLKPFGLLVFSLNCCTLEGDTWEHTSQLPSSEMVCRIVLKNNIRNMDAICEF